MTIHNRQDFHTFPPAGGTDALATALGHGKCCINEALALVDGAFFAQRIGELRENLAQHLAFTPLLEPAMHGLVIGIALREQVPLGAGVQNPEHRFQDGPRRHRFATGPAFRDVFLRKVLPDAVPLVVAQTQHTGAL